MLKFSSIRGCSQLAFDNCRVRFPLKCPSISRLLDLWRDMDSPPKQSLPGKRKLHMKQSNSPTRTFLSLFAFAAIGCSPLVSSQPGVPPIEMPIEQFNQGRPADFYYLADVSEGYEAVCAEVLEALNEPYPGEPYAEYNEPYSKYLLRSRLSVPWIEMPQTSRSSGRSRWNVRYVSVDIDNDGIEEDVFVDISNLSASPVHNFAILRKGLLPVQFQEVTEEIFENLIAEGAYRVGRSVSEQFSKVLADNYSDYNYEAGGTLRIRRHFLDVINLNSARYILLTGSSPVQTSLELMLLELDGMGSVSAGCRLKSRYVVR